MDTPRPAPRPRRSGDREGSGRRMRCRLRRGEGEGGTLRGPSGADAIVPWLDPQGRLDNDRTRCVRDRQAVLRDGVQGQAGVPEAPRTNSFAKITKSARVVCPAVAGVEASKSVAGS